MLCKWLMVLCLINFTYSSFNVNHLFLLLLAHSYNHLYFWYVFNKSYPGWLNAVAYWGTWGRASWYGPGGHSFPLYKKRMKVFTSASVLQERVSAQLTRCMHKHSHQKEHDIFGASCDDVRHHMMMFQWHGGFQMSHLHQYWKGYKR